MDMNLGPEFLSLREAAEYLGVSMQTLRRWDVSGRVKAVRHPSSGYLFFNRGDLEPFRLEYRRAEMQSPGVGEFFARATANIEQNEKLREPQREAYVRTREHFTQSTAAAILQIPVGCGKTGVIATLPFGVSTGRVLVIVPNTTIRKGVAEALDITSPKCFWTRTRVLTSVMNGPYRAVLDGPDANLHDCVESHFVVTNIQQLASSADRWLPQFPPNFFDMILVDEGHHNVAESWRKVFERFPGAKVVSLTATPFRSDGKPVSGERIYRYPYAHAMVNGYIKQLHAVTVAPSEIFFTYRDDARRLTLDEVMELREEAWFRRGIALAPECNTHIVEASIARCLALREQTGVKHQIIAAACSVDHARQVRSLYEQSGMVAREIYSEMDPDKRDAVLEDLKSRKLDCIVQVQMLGEGFDHPPLSVAAVFRPFRSLSAYIQFVGRIMRVMPEREGEPDHPDNQGYVVSHVGLNNDLHWADFREFDLEDQKVVHSWLFPEEIVRETSSQGKSRRFDNGMRVADEIVSHFISESFLNPDDDRVIEMLRNQKVPGTPLKVGDLISAENLRATLRKAQEAKEQTPQEVPVLPQRRRQAVRTRLNERTRSVARRVLDELGLARPGREIGRVIRSARGTTNDRALYALMHAAVNDLLGIKSRQRATLSREQCETAFAALDQLGDQVRDKVKNAIGGERV